MKKLGKIVPKKVGNRVKIKINWLVITSKELKQKFILQPFANNQLPLHYSLEHPDFGSFFFHSVVREKKIKRWISLTTNIDIASRLHYTFFCVLEVDKYKLKQLIYTYC